MELNHNIYKNRKGVLIDITKLSLEEAEKLQTEVEERLKQTKSLITRKQILAEKLNSFTLLLSRQIYFKQENEEQVETVVIDKQLIKQI